MSSIHDLIAKLCPSGVCFKRLGDVARIKNGKDHKTLADGKYPVYGSGGIMRYANSYAYDKPSVLIPRKGSLDNLFFVDTPFWNVDTIFYTEIDEAQIYPKFFYYFLQTVGLGEMNQAGGVPSQTQSVLNEIKIPVPPIQIQAEIVRILDAMTAHTAELTAELTARKKQYNYYRDKLLSFEDGEVEWLDLDTLAKIKTGQSVNKQMISDNPGEYAVINSGREPLGFIDVWNTDNDPIGITSRGVGVGSITWREGKYFRGNLNYSVTIKNKDKISIRYLYHILQKMQLEIQALCTFDGIPALNASNLKTLEIPVPLLDEQNRIVAILDKFDALTASITEGLPREIELREKQYAYYRDLLLSFPQAQAT